MERKNGLSRKPRFDPAWRKKFRCAGSQEARDDLSMILRQTLRVLFAQYKNLSVVEQMEWDGEWVPRATLEKMGIIPADEMAEVAALK